MGQLDRAGLSAVRALTNADVVSIVIKIGPNVISPANLTFLLYYGTSSFFPSRERVCMCVCAGGWRVCVCVRVALTRGFVRVEPPPPQLLSLDPPSGKVAGGYNVRHMGGNDFFPNPQELVRTPHFLALYPPLSCRVVNVC